MINTSQTYNNLNQWQQESPPAWMQEAYRPPRSCSVSRSPNGGGGVYPNPVLRGLPPSSPYGQGTPIQSWWEVPHPVPMGGTPSSPDWGGATLSSPDRGWYPIQFQGGTASQIGGYPPSSPGKGVLPLSAGWGPPRWVWTNRRLWKHYLPHPSDAFGKNQLNGACYCIQDNVRAL